MKSRNYPEANLKCAQASPRGPFLADLSNLVGIGWPVYTGNSVECSGEWMGLLIYVTGGWLPFANGNRLGIVIIRDRRRVINAWLLAFQSVSRFR